MGVARQMAVSERRRRAQASGKRLIRTRSRAIRTEFLCGWLTMAIISAACAGQDRSVLQADPTTTPSSAAESSSSIPQELFRGYITISATGVSATVEPLLTLPPGAKYYTPPGDYVLELLDADGNVLRWVPFGPHDFHIEGRGPDPSEPKSEIWGVAVEEPPDWASYRVLGPSSSSSGTSGAEGAVSSRVLVEVTRSANAPVVSVTSPTTGQILSGDEMTFAWTGFDADGDDLTYTVQYSDDGGASYETIALDYESTTLTVDRIWLSGAETARIKVTVSDGTRIASAESAVFAMAQNAPTVNIQAPGPEPVQGVLILRATAYDAEDGRLDSSAIQWTSDIDGYLGTGSSVVHPELMAAGMHRLTATATDSAGATGTAEVIWENPIPASPPDAPMGLTAVGGDGWIDLTWNPSDDPSILTYQIRERPSYDDDWWCWADVQPWGPDTTTYRVPKLSSATTYQIQLRALNGRGDGATIEVSATTSATPQPPAAVPVAPAGLAAFGRDSSIVVIWNNPNDHTILEYQLREKPDDETNWRCWQRIHHSDASLVSDTFLTGHTARGIANDLHYRVQVRAINPTGPGKPSETSATPTAGTYRIETPSP